MSSLTLTFSDNMLTIHGPHLPGGAVEICYMETYCRAGSTARDWGQTAMMYQAELLRISEDGKQVRMRHTVCDGTLVEHVITAGADEIDFRLTAHNPTDKTNEAMWVQPCIRVGRFAGSCDGCGGIKHLPKCFVFLDGELTRMPTHDWATEGLYTPGQTWCPEHVCREDVNPRPLSPLVPSNGLIGCFSGDESLVLATAWQPYQELFAGVITCIHADPTIGPLAPGESRDIYGKIYIVPADIPALLARYETDFPEHCR
ncbi:MAG: hypothetical protein ABFD92_08195 [Planctomycetaceae bacterium]|nr:hypothetical protein [Planctomycetaceae bacterium]